jgi:hypothetical protein
MHLEGAERHSSKKKGKKKEKKETSILLEASSTLTHGLCTPDVSPN